MVECAYHEQQLQQSGAPLFLLTTLGLMDRFIIPFVSPFWSTSTFSVRCAEAFSSSKYLCYDGALPAFDLADAGV